MFKNLKKLLTSNKADKIGEICNYIGSVLLVSSYPSQVYTIYKLKDVTSLALSFWIVLTLGLTFIVVNALIRMLKYKKKAFFIGQLANIICGLIIICQIFMYR